MCHLKRFIRPKTRDTEPGRYRLPRLRTITIRVIRKCRSTARNIHHLTLQQCLIKILGEPDGPMIPQPLLPSSFCHSFHTKSPKISFSPSLLWESTKRQGGFMNDFKGKPPYAVIKWHRSRFWFEMAENLFQFFYRFFLFYRLVPIISFSSS
jgi:hypothetical protein